MNNNVNKYDDAKLNVNLEIQQTFKEENKEDIFKNDDLKREKELKEKELLDVRRNYYEKLLKKEETLNKSMELNEKEEEEEDENKKEETLNRLSKIKTDEIWLNNEGFLLKNAEIFKKKPILINILKDIGIMKPEMDYYYDFIFDENGKELTTMEKLKNLEERLDIINKVYKKKIKKFREKLEKNCISNEDRDKCLKKNEILNYFKDFKIKLEKYDDAIKYLNNLRFRVEEEIKLFEKNFKKEKNKNNVNLKIFVITLKLKLKELLRKDAQNLEKLIKHFYDNYHFFNKYDERILGTMGELLNIYLKFAINLYKKFLDKTYFLEKVTKKKVVKEEQEDIFKKVIEKFKDKKELVIPKSAYSRFI